MGRHGWAAGPQVEAAPTAEAEKQVGQACQAAADGKAPVEWPPAQKCRKGHTPWLVAALHPRTMGRRCPAEQRLVALVVDLVGEADRSCTAVELVVLAVGLVAEEAGHTGLDVVAHPVVAAELASPVADLLELRVRVVAQRKAHSLVEKGQHIQVDSSQSCQTNMRNHCHHQAVADNNSRAKLELMQPAAEGSGAGPRPSPCRFHQSKLRRIHHCNCCRQPLLAPWPEMLQSLTMALDRDGAGRRPKATEASKGAPLRTAPAG
mmetsp:Transcript_39099/g.125712  ORF Transcript_39099/g.125712 Transcript_39099/m.125712 type:complete len:263 (+) Transcript_39099:5274-6062(+)